MRRIGEAPLVGDRGNRLAAQERIGQVIGAAFEPGPLYVAANTVVLLFEEPIQMPHRNIQAIGQAYRAQAWLGQGLIDDFLHIVAQAVALQGRNLIPRHRVLLECRAEQRDERRLQCLALADRTLTDPAILAQLIHEHMQHPPTGLA